ncbi:MULTISPECIES: sensor histidine kinase [Bacillaceae]|uniref:sensor histidine kinase n=1 Tax=Bacillaceae TaxID=186817 RepID=UPI0004E0E7E7|nr:MULTISPECIES: ATP-binding protein [Bacillaceae]MCF2647239.1 HAMP domain-containing protein [Niallia circulans]CAI9390255.1 Signal transduction histidine-protein kinase BaeS [Bacillus sp. T2.9-1]
MNLTLRTRILLYLLVVSLSGVFITSFTIFFGVENQFTDYLQKNREERIETIKKEVLQQYDETGELTNEELNNMLHQQAMTENLYFKLYDSNGEILIDSTSLRSMMGMMNGTQSSIDPNDYQSTSYQLKNNNEVIGNLTVFYPEQLMGEDFIFLKSIKRNILIAVLVTVILSILFSLLFSNRLTSGFKKLINAIAELRNHQWRTRIQVKELTDEMRPLGESFNQLAESLAKEETLRKEFTANFAHELRTPLATLRSHIEAFQDGIWEPDSKRLEQCHEELMRLVRLVNELEKLIAAENPQIRLDKTRLETGKLLSFIKEQFNPLFMKKGVDLEVQNTEEQHWFSGDRDKVIQILTNIVNNALQYTPPGKRVSVYIEEKNDQISFIVKDEGEGISEDDLPFLFERFYRGDKSRDRKTGGVGIGLSIVKAFVEAHQGKIKIESQSNVGTTVEVQLPKK